MLIHPVVVASLFVTLLSGCSSPQGVYHPVAEGQTLYRISRTYGVEPDYLARVNGVSDPTQLRAGQLLFVPGATHLKPVSSTVTTKTPLPKVAPPPKPAPVPPVTVSKSASHPSHPPSSRTTTKTPSPAKGKFIYPVKGKIVKTFGEKRGEINRGIELAAPQGAPIVSAAAGRVIYSGNGVKGYGNLIILKHDDSYYTVYGFNSKNLVPTGAFVSKGEKIALCGTPPSGGVSRLHFEIRHGKDAVNPIFYLP
ncbi:peptidoglycan DD-metalloendopeptidase family protein [Trichloromonas sp.]|uniref:peptidoglycan DD-metalloendopeptidase family protein n=1 Tax=Trichloromonas sp. TaxID=3069249 RepID=UPI003D81C452